MDRVRRMIGCDSRSATYYTGRGVYIAVLDSGVARHPDLEGRIIGFRDFSGKNNRSRQNEGYYDDNGHGTHV